jgi:hypothetical protein
MKSLNSLKDICHYSVAFATTFIAAGVLLYGATVAHADDSGYTMAPPIAANASPGPDNSSDTSADAASTVFNWQELPVNQKVPLTRAVFDQGGYQLYDTVGETVLIPFKDNNLFVMKFAVSPDETTYFENSGEAPILFVPQDGYLENATVPGAKWYPFTADFAPADPVYLGVAPSWSDYVGIGWYPNMDCYGGYWRGSTFGEYQPSVGLCISFGDNTFFGWGNYDNFLVGFPAPYFVGFYHSGVYHYGNRAYWGGRSFRGFSGNAYGGDRHYGGGYTNRAYGDGDGGGRANGGGYTNRAYGDAAGGGRGYGGYNGNTAPDRQFRGTFGGGGGNYNPVGSYRGQNYGYGYGSRGGYGDVGNNNRGGTYGGGQFNHTGYNSVDHSGRGSGDTGGSASTTRSGGFGNGGYSGSVDNSGGYGGGDHGGGYSGGDRNGGSGGSGDNGGGYTGGSGGGDHSGGFGGGNHGGGFGGGGGNNRR